MENNYPVNFSFFSGKKVPVITHLAVWGFFFILPTYLLHLDAKDDHTFLLRSYLQIFLYALIFYANYLWFTPKLFLRNRKVLYFIVAIVLVAVATIVNEITFRSFVEHRPGAQSGMEFRPNMQPPGLPLRPGDPFPKDHKRPSKNWPLYNFLVTTLFISGFGMGLSFSDKLRQHEKERKEAEKEKLNSELAFLKNQINPHFFFNTLNNIYSLVQTDVSDGQKAILQLSKLMRYLLYETEKGETMLSEEISFLTTYFELMKLRISDKVDLSIKFPETYNDFAIPPLLFLPFIENAFKHGISYRRASFVNIELKIDTDKLIFNCNNSIGSQVENLLKSDTGIGLENVKKRLKLLFPGSHDLVIHETDSSFNVRLEIGLPLKTSV
jgi:two-component system, LytTR family, sensor kinase